MKQQDMPGYSDFVAGLRARRRSEGDFVLSPEHLDRMITGVDVRSRLSQALGRYPVATWVADFLADLDAGKFD
jgi:hypothetical protein